MKDLFNVEHENGDSHLFRSLMEFNIMEGGRLFLERFYRSLNTLRNRLIICNF